MTMADANFHRKGMTARETCILDLDDDGVNDVMNPCV